MPPSFDDDDIARAVANAHALAAGRRYQQDGRAHIVAIGEGGRRITGEVRGTAPAPYRQDIQAHPRSYGGAWFASSCTCPVRSNCKHVAAVLFQLLADEGSAPRPRLTPELGFWLEGLEHVIKRGPSEQPALAPRYQLFYLINLGFGHANPRNPVVKLVSVRLGKDARPGEAKSYDAANVVGRVPAKYVTDADIAILARLAAIKRKDWGGGYDLSGSSCSELFDRIVATGRARWCVIDAPPLVAAGTRAATIGWDVLGDGTQRAVVVHDGVTTKGPSDIVTLALAPPRWLDPATGAVGTLETDLAATLASAMLQAPDVPAHAVEPMRERLTKLGFTGTGLPRLLGGAEPLDIVPQPIAVVTMVAVTLARGGRAGSNTQWRGTGFVAELAVVRLMFDYAGRRVGAASGLGAFTLMHDDRFVRVARRPEENVFGARLAAAGLRHLGEFSSFEPAPDQALDFVFDAAARPLDLAPFLLDTRAALETEGWKVEIAASFPLQLAAPDDTPWRVEIEEDCLKRVEGGPRAGTEPSGTDWFGATLGVEVDGRRIDVLPAVVALLALLPAGRDPADLDALPSGQHALTVPLDDGRTLALPFVRVQPVLSALWHLFAGAVATTADGPVRVSKWQAGELAHLGMAAGIDVAAPERIARLAHEFGTGADGAPTPLPPGFSATLRPYQQAGLDRMQRLARAGFGLVLADDMGLGKTVQTLAHLAVEHAGGRFDAPALVLAPTSVLSNWMSEAAAFVPRLRVHLWSGPDRLAGIANLVQADIVVTSWPLLARDTDVLRERRWSIVVADEAQFVRNPATAAAQALFALDRRQTIALTGTPVENSLADVWSLGHATNPGLLGTPKEFKRRFQTPIEKHGNADTRLRLARRLRPFLLRRTKNEVAADLPSRTEIIEVVTLEGAQAALYEGVRLAMQERVRATIATKGLARSHIVVLDALLKLRQACCDPRLVKIKAPTAKTATKRGKVVAPSSAKLARLLELLATFRDEGRSVLLFSQFTSMLALIRAELDAQGRVYAWLTGDTKDRATPVRRFQSGEVDLFLVSLKAGGTGLNLTTADAVILYDPWWNPAVEAQAIDRAHRIGQTRPVFVHRLIAAGTVEEKMIALQLRKRELAAALWDADVGDKHPLDKLTSEDVVALFE